MKKISVFENLIKEVGSQSLTQIMKEIRGNRYKTAVLKIRELVKSGDQDKAEKLKKELVAFTVSGLFEGGPKMVFLKTYNPFVILNINKLNPEVIPYLVLKIKAIEFTKAAFLSPSGSGLKVIVEVDSKMKMHSLAYHQVCDFYEKELKIRIVKGERNITRLCFMSHDPKAYFNPKSTVYKVIESEIEIERFLQPSTDTIPGRATEFKDKEANLTVNYPQVFDDCVMEANAKLVYQQGNRNNYIYQLGVICNCAELPIEVAIDESNKAFDLSKSEIEGTIKSAYNWEPFESVKKTGIIHLGTPRALPSEVFDKLPELLKKGCGALKDVQERDMFLTSALSVLGGCLPAVDGVYDGRLYSPNLFFFMVDPIDNGRSAMRFAKSLVTSDTTRKVEKNGKQSERSNAENLFIPGHLSLADLVFNLNHNEGSGILFEPEVHFSDENLRKERSDYADFLDISFYHEPYCFGRKSSKDYVEIKRPKLSIAFSGRLGQLEKLIPSGENFLFSRFMFYAFEPETLWRDVSPDAYGQDLQFFYSDLSEEVSEMIHFLKSNRTEFTLSKNQWITMNETFQKIADETSLMFGKEAKAIVHVMGVNCFRIAMILSAIRKFQEKRTEVELVCSDEDFQVAILLAETYLSHGFFVYEQLEKRMLRNLGI